jgi:CheY-like chemotaxis protein
LTPPIPMQILGAMKRANILVADDDPVTRQYLSGVLRPDGHTVQLASDAAQALMLAMRSPPDAVILDIGMPGGSGFHVLQRLKASSKTSMIPVIVVTVSNDETIAAKARDGGAAEFFHKPVSAADLRGALARCLETEAPPPAA